jgi:hypothetical protein
VSSANNRAGHRFSVVTVTDKAQLDALKADPGAFYANLHTAEFPGDAVRGRLDD